MKVDEGKGYYVTGVVEEMEPMLIYTYKVYPTDSGAIANMWDEYESYKVRYVVLPSKAFRMEYSIAGEHDEQRENNDLLIKLQEEEGLMSDPAIQKIYDIHIKDWIDYDYLDIEIQESEERAGDHIYIL